MFRVVITLLVAAAAFMAGNAPWHVGVESSLPAILTDVAVPSSIPSPPTPSANSQFAHVPESTRAPTRPTIEPSVHADVETTPLPLPHTTAEGVSSVAQESRSQAPPLPKADVAEERRRAPIDATNNNSEGSCAAPSEGEGVSVSYGQPEQPPNPRRAEMELALRDFQVWFQTSAQGKADGIELDQFPGYGTGVRTTRPVHENENVLVVPLTSVICRETILSRADAQEAAIYSGIRADSDLIAAFLLYERARGRKSWWAPYIRVLPTHIPLPLFYSEDELALLQDDKIAADARNERARLTRAYESVRPALETLLSKTRRPQDVTLDAFLWASSVVSSRALTMWGTRYLVPFADMFNYKPQRSLRQQDNGSNFLKHHRIEGPLNSPQRRFEVSSDRKCREGHQLFEDYGDSKNDVFMTYHGFASPDNPFECAEATIPAVSARFSANGTEYPAFARKRDLLERIGFQPPPSVCLRPHNIANPVTLRYIRLLVASPAEFDACEDEVAKGDRALTAMESCCQRCVEAAYHELRALLRATTAAKYPTSLQEDMARRQASESENERAALSYPIARKTIAKRVASKLHALAERARRAAEGEDDGAEGVVAARVTAHSLAVRDGNNLEEAVAAFNAWMDSQRFPVRKVKAATSPAMRIAAVATENVEFGDLYLAVPASSILDVRYGQSIPEVAAFLSALDADPVLRGDQGEKLSGVLVREYFGNANSPFLPYLRLLPRPGELDVPLFWPADLISRELMGSVVANDIAMYSADVERSAQAMSALAAAHPTAFPDGCFSIQRYKWARAIIDSRTIWWEGRRQLVPMLDFINCRACRKIHSTTFDANLKAAVTRAGDTFAAGEELFEDYGQPNNIYLHYHGFILQPNNHDCARVLLHIPESHPNGVPTEDYMHKAVGTARTKGFGSMQHASCVRAGAIPERTMGFARSVLLLDKETPENNALAAAWLISQFERMLSAYPTTAEADRALIESGTLDRRTETIVRFRLGEKTHISSVIEHLRARV